MFFLFTYGTLMSGKSNHSYLNNSRFVGDAVIKGYKMYDYLLEDTVTSMFPVIFKTGLDTDVVYGEVYRCNDELLRPLDKLENNTEMYNRESDIVYINNLGYSVMLYIGIVDYWQEYSTKLYDISNLQEKWKYRNYLEEDVSIIKDVFTSLETEKQLA